MRISEELPIIRGGGGPFLVGVYKAFNFIRVILGSRIRRAKVSFISFGNRSLSFNFV